MAEKMKVYNLEEIADILQVTRRTVYNYLRDGRLKGSKIGKYWRVTDKQLEDFLKPTNNPEA